MTNVHIFMYVYMQHVRMYECIYACKYMYVFMYMSIAVNVLLYMCLSCFHLEPFIEAIGQYEAPTCREEAAE